MFHQRIELQAHNLQPYSSNYTAEGDNAMTQEGPDKDSHCGHGDLRGLFGLFVQALLALLAFCSLIVKRYCEPKHSRRPWMIWFFDTSKQGVGAAVLHFANLFLSEVFLGDPCTWYFISFLLDSTVGLLVIYIGLKSSQIISHRYGWKTLYFGEYGDPPKCNAWVGQCALYILVMIVVKLLMALLLLFKFWTQVRKFIMSPITNPNVEIVLVMFVVPLVVNAIIFWVVDNFLKQSIQSGKTIYIQTAGANEGKVKYFRNLDTVKCYSRIERAEDGDCDMLLSADDEADSRNRRRESSHRNVRS